MNVKNIPCETFYNELANIYSWHQVAERTERVYDFAMTRPSPNMLQRIKSSISWGPLVGLWALVYTIIEAIVLCLLEWLWPLHQIDICRSFDSATYNQAPLSYGAHDFQVDSRVKTRKEEGVTLQLVSHQYNSLARMSQSSKVNRRSLRYDISKP